MYCCIVISRIISLHCIVYCKFFNNYDSNNKDYKSEKPSKWYNSETVIIVDDCMRPRCYSLRKLCWNFYGVTEETLRISTWMSVLGCLTYLTSQVTEHKFCIWQFKSYILVSINKVSRDKCNGLRNMNK